MLFRSIRSIASPFSRPWRYKSTLRVVESNGARSLALPLCFLSVKGLDSTGWQEWIAKFSAKGYSSLVVDLDPEPSLESTTTSQDLLSSLEQELVSVLRSTSSPFPPLLFASSASTLIAETYVSSHPLSGLVLDRPLSARHAHETLPNWFKTRLDEFDYEPFFPVAVVVAEKEGAPTRENRLVREFGGDDEDALVRRIIGDRDEQGWDKVMEWMDENGL